MPNPEAPNHQGKDTKGKLTRAALTVGKIAAISVVTGMASGAGVTLKNHREETHRSIKLAGIVRKGIAFDQASQTIGDSTVWDATHRVHHSKTDVAIKPFFDIRRAIKWAKENPDKAATVAIPESFPHLDPFVDSFSLDDVMKIGELAEQEVKERMGEAYQEPTGYTPEELRQVLEPTKPMYQYKPDRKRKKGTPYTQDEIAERLLGDPHSPIRVPPPERNGVRGILRKNVARYSDVAKMFTEMPDLKPKDLQHKDGKNTTSSPWHVAAGILLPSVAVLLKRGEYKPKDFVKAGILGTMLYAGKITFVIGGGNVTNSFGHAGFLNDRQILNAVGRKEFKPILNSDGTLTTDTKYSGPLGRMLSTLTLDEVGGQAVHHAYPEKIAYTTKTGMKGFAEAPFGTIVEKLADAKWFPLIKRGKGFDLKEGEVRPDMPHPAVKIIQDRRAEQLRREQEISKGRIT